MDFLIKAISFFWLVRTIKFVLFWIYLWQLKEYHVGRFVDHFRTHKGKKILFDTLPAVKFILLLFLLTYPEFLYILLLVYVLESLLFLFGIIKKRVKKPILTFKALFLIAVCVVGMLIHLFLTYYYYQDANLFVYGLLLFDILIPAFVSLVVLVFQPFFVLARNRILQRAKDKIAQYKNLTVIAITGSYGKTSTKEFLTTILSSKFKVVSTPDHKNSEVGIAQTILQDLQSEHQIFIMEMGAYNKGKIQELCRMVKPTIGIVTGVNEQHLATFGSLDNLLSAEGGRELAASLPKDGLLVVNGDNKYCLDLYEKFSGNKKVYTTKKGVANPDIWAEELVVKKESISFVAKSKDSFDPAQDKGQAATFTVNVLGGQNIQNMLAAILVARELGMSFEQISQACKNITQKQAGIVLRRGIQGIDIIDSSYSSNPDGVMADLEYLSVFSGKKVIVMPCLIELGDKSIEVHIKIGKKIADICDLAIITTKDKFEEIKMGAAAGGMPEDKILLCDKPVEIAAQIPASYKEGDAVLLEGGRPKELIRLLSKKIPN